MALPSHERTGQTLGNRNYTENLIMARLSHEWIGQKLAGRYRVTKELLPGGMAKVFLADDINRFDAQVVIKTPDPILLLEDPDFAKRFQFEVRALIDLTYPHVMTTLDVGEYQGMPFYVMPFLSGGSVADRRPLDNHSQAMPMQVEDLCSWLELIAKTLDFIHSQGYVHRDVKPGNILFDQHLNVYLSDFGIAKALGPHGGQGHTAMFSRDGVVFGTPEYMAPEVRMGAGFDGRADQYSLGVMVHELLAGRLPFEATNAFVLGTKHEREPPPVLAELQPDLPRHVSNAVLRALSKAPAERFTNCVDFVRVVLNPPIIVIPPCRKDGDPPPIGPIPPCPVPPEASETGETDREHIGNVVQLLAKRANDTVSDFSRAVNRVCGEWVMPFMAMPIAFLLYIGLICLPYLSGDKIELTKAPNPSSPVLGDWAKEAPPDAASDKADEDKKPYDGKKAEEAKAESRQSEAPVNPPDKKGEEPKVEPPREKPNVEIPVLDTSNPPRGLAITQKKGVRTELFYDGELHPEAKGAYLSLGEKSVVIGNNSEGKGPAVAFTQGNRFLDNIASEQHVVMSAGRDTDAKNKAEEGTIKITNRGDTAPEVTTDKSFRIENGNAILSKKKSKNGNEENIVLELNKKEKRKTYAMEVTNPVLNVNGQQYKYVIDGNNQVHIYQLEESPIQLNTDLRKELNRKPIARYNLGLTGPVEKADGVELERNNAEEARTAESWSAPNQHPDQNEHIVEVNGRQINSIDDFFDAVKRSPDMMIFRVFNPRTKRSYTMRTWLLVSVLQRAEYSATWAKTRVDPITAESLGIYFSKCSGAGAHIAQVAPGSPFNQCQTQLPTPATPRIFAPAAPAPWPTPAPLPAAPIADPSA